MESPSSEIHHKSCSDANTHAKPQPDRMHKIHAKFYRRFKDKKAKHKQQKISIDVAVPNKHLLLFAELLKCHTRKHREDQKIKQNDSCLYKIM